MKAPSLSNIFFLMFTALSDITLLEDDDDAL